MQSNKSNAIVLKVSPYRSRSCIATFISEELGLRQGFFRLRKEYSFRSNLEIGNLLQIETTPSSTAKNLISIAHYEIHTELLNTGQVDPNWYQKWLYCNFWAELTCNTAIDSLSNEKWFNSTLQIFQIEQQDPPLWSWFFGQKVLYYLAEIGYPFDWQSCLVCKKPSFVVRDHKFFWRPTDHFLDLTNHGICCRQCNRSLTYKVPHQAIKIWHELQADQPKKIPNDAFNQYLKIIVEILQHYFQITMKSWLFFPNELSADQQGKTTPEPTTKPL